MGRLGRVVCFPDRERVDARVQQFVQRGALVASGVGQGGQRAGSSGDGLLEGREDMVAQAVAGPARVAVGGVVPAGDLVLPREGLQIGAPEGEQRPHNGRRAPWPDR